MEHIFSLQRKKIIDECIGAICILSISGFACYQIIENKVNRTFFLFPLLLASIGVIIILRLRRKIIINDDNIICISGWRTTKIVIDDIIACRIDGGVEIALGIPNSKNIRISNCTDFVDADRLFDYFKTYWPNLDDIELNENIYKIVIDENLGSNTDDKVMLLRKARKITLYYNWVGFLVSALLFIFNIPSITLIALVYPLVAIILMGIGRKVIRFAPNKKVTLYASVFSGFLFPASALTIRAATGFEIFSYDNFWLTFLIVTFIIFSLLILFGKDQESGNFKFQVVMMIVFSILYGYGAVLVSNCSMDGSATVTNHAKVVEHETVVRNNNNSFMLTLNALDNNQRPMKVETSKEFYYQTYKGDTLEINFRKGFLNIPWFTLSRP